LANLLEPVRESIDAQERITGAEIKQTERSLTKSELKVIVTDRV
jgi:hypothetical protein